MRRKVIILGIVVFAILAIWSCGWLWAASAVHDGIASLATEDGETEPQLTCSSLDVGGFPFRFDATCAGATVTWGDETITAGGLKASALVYDLPHVIFSLKAPITTENAFTGSASSFDFSGLEGSIHLIPRDLVAGMTTGRGWRIERISIVADGIKWSDTVADPFLQASADHVEMHLVDVPSAHDAKAGIAGLAAFATVRNLVAPGYQISAGDGTVEAELTGLPDDLQVLSDDPDPLRHWQQRGGTLTIAQLKGSQPDPQTVFDVTGTASLTEAGLLDMSLDYTTRNVFTRLVGLLPSYEIPLLEGAVQPDGTSKNSIRITDGKLKLLTFTILDLPPLF